MSLGLKTIASKKYGTPRRGTKSERIVEILRSNPYASYAKILRLSGYRGMSHQAIINIAFKYDLQRGNNLVCSEDRQKICSLIKTTVFPYSLIGRMAGGYGRQTVRNIAISEGLHNPQIRNKRTAIEWARTPISSEPNPGHMPGS